MAVEGTVDRSHFRVRQVRAANRIVSFGVHKCRAARTGELACCTRSYVGTVRHVLHSLTIGTHCRRALAKGAWIQLGCQTTGTANSSTRTGSYDPHSSLDAARCSWTTLTSSVQRATHGRVGVIAHSVLGFRANATADTHSVSSPLWRRVLDAVGIRPTCFGVA